MNNCTVSENCADDCEGGGIHITGGTLTMNNCTVILNNCTVSGNFSDDNRGGGIWNESGTVTMNNCTVSRNEANSGGGGILNRGDLTLENTIVAGNNADRGEPDLDGDGTLFLEGANVTEGDPMLAALDFHGGPTRTMPPMPGSPAIDSGIPTANTPPTDQRGLPRLVGGGLDIGAYEAEEPDLRPISSISLAPAGLRLTTRPVFFRRVGVEYSPDMSPGSWIELGNFFASADGVMEFTDPDPVRLARQSGYYRAFLRPP